MSDFQGRSALITGASRGIGAATAIALAKQGAARVVIQYNSYPEGAQAVVAAAKAAGAEAEAIQADLGTVDGIHRFVDEVTQRIPGPDILVNNAGSLVKRCPMADYTEELFDTVMNLNVKSLWFISKAVAPAMIARKSGAIVHVSSIAARNGGGPGATIYSAAKAAVAAITKGMSKELAPKGIRVNAISPGTVDNHFHEVFSNRDILDGVVKMTPAGRLGTNEDMADSILFLCSGKADYIHGQTIEINGGMFMI
ncbi:MAG: SDR family oxidoreductase [Bryobacteraceae bacterium]